MTAAAGFPIASAIASAGTSAVPQPTKPAHTGAASFRSGFEALIDPIPASSAQTAPTQTISKEEKYSDAAQGETMEASDSTGRAAESAAKPALFPQNENRKKFDLTAASASAFEGAAQSQPHRTENSISAASSRAAKNLQQNPATLPVVITAKTDLPAASGKQTSSERAAPQKQTATTNHDSKTASLTFPSSSESFAPVLVPVPSPAPDPGHAFAPQAGSTSAASGYSGFTAETVHSKPVSVCTLPASTAFTSIEPEGKTVSIEASADAEPVNSISALEASTRRSLTTNAESDTQAAIQHTTSQLPSPDTDSALKTSSTQSNPANVSNTLQPAIIGPQSLADSPQAHAPANHASAPRERGLLQHDLSSAGTQPTIAITSQPTLARDSADITGVLVDRAGGTSQSAQPPTDSPAARDTFAALDADPGQPSATWIHSGPRQVEAGYQDPSLGWVSVRADLTPGGLHASVVPNSSEAAQALGGHLSGLNTYLAEHHGGTITASLAAPENHSSTQGQGLGQNSGQHNQSGAQQQKEPSESAPAQTASSQAISAGSTQTSDPAARAPKHTGLISVIA